MAAFMCALKKFINILAVITSSIKIGRNATQHQESFVRRRLMVLGEFVLKPFVASTLIDLPGDNSTRQSLMKFLKNA
jgi:hypothetical protein